MLGRGVGEHLGEMARRESIGDAMVSFLSGHHNAAATDSTTPHLEGKLCKKSDWFGTWDERDFSVHPANAKNSTPAQLVWHGGRQEGSLTLYVYTDVSIETRHEEGDRLLVNNGERQMIFSASPGGPTLQEWHDAILGAATDDPGGLRRRVSSNAPPAFVTTASVAEHNRAEANRVAPIAEEEPEAEPEAEAARAEDSRASTGSRRSGWSATSWLQEVPLHEALHAALQIPEGSDEFAYVSSLSRERLDELLKGAGLSGHALGMWAELTKLRESSASSGAWKRVWARLQAERKKRPVGGGDSPSSAAAQSRCIEVLRTLRREAATPVRLPVLAHADRLPGGLRGVSIDTLRAFVAYLREATADFVEGGKLVHQLSSQVCCAPRAPAARASPRSPQHSHVPAVFTVSCRRRTRARSTRPSQASA